MKAVFLHIMSFIVKKPSTIVFFSHENCFKKYIARLILTNHLTVLLKVQMVVNQFVDRSIKSEIFAGAATGDAGYQPGAAAQGPRAASAASNANAASRVRKLV